MDVTVADVLVIIETRVNQHVSRVGRLGPAVEDYQRLVAWHRATIMALIDLRDEIVRQQESRA